MGLDGRLIRSGIFTEFLMECPVHAGVEVVGYCSVCGAFGCAECLTRHEGQYYCARHYRPISKRLEAAREHEAIRRKHPQQRMVVHYRDGRSVTGVCFSLNLKEEGFHLDRVDDSGASLGETVYVKFSAIKAVFLVKSFDGNYDKDACFDAWTPEGEELVVKFRDGEVVEGRSLRGYREDVPRFYLVPSEGGNNISVLVERSAAEAVYRAEDYRAKVAEERARAKAQGAPSDMSQEESLGDFYFEMRNYAEAIAHYRQAAGKNPEARRPRKKLLAAQYNMGVDHIKRHEYAKALVLMEGVLKANPDNERVRKKVGQLRRIIEKSGPPRGPAAE